MRQVLPDVFSRLPLVSIDLPGVEVLVAGFQGRDARRRARDAGADPEAQAGNVALI